MSASIELSVLLALSLLVGLGALFQIHHRGSRFLGGGRAGAAGGANPIPKRRSCTSLVIGILSVLCIVNAIVAFLAPQVPVEIEVPISKAGAAATGSPMVQADMTTTGAGAAIVLACLAAAALVVNANKLWHLYVRAAASEQPLPLGAPLAAQAYVLGIHTLPWLGYVVRDQLSMRRAKFAINLGQDAAIWGLLVLFILMIGLHAMACFAAAGAFAGQARALRRGMERVESESPSTTLAIMHRLQYRAILYAIGSFLLYLYIFWSFMIYPHNLRLATTTTPFHLALVLLLLFCFPPALQLQPTASGGAGEGDDGMHDLCVFSPATMEMQEAGTRRSEGGASAASAASPGAWSLRSQL